MTRIKMPFQELMTMEMNQLGWKCVEPMLIQVRGKSPQVKEEIYSRLSTAQKAIFLFFAFHNHVDSPEDLYRYTHYYNTDVRIWPALLEGLRFYGDQELIEVLEATRRIIEEKLMLPDGSWAEAGLHDLEQDQILAGQLQTLYDSYRSCSVQSIHTINTYVSSHLDEFIEIV